MTRWAAVASILLVGGLLAVWWSRAGAARTTAHPHRPAERMVDSVPPPESDAEPNRRELLVIVRDAASGAALPGSTIVATPWNGSRVQVVTDAAGNTSQLSLALP